jgi:hypothetical protein
MSFYDGWTPNAIFLAGTWVMLEHVRLLMERGKQRETLCAEVTVQLPVELASNDLATANAALGPLPPRPRSTRAARVGHRLVYQWTELGFELRIPRSDNSVPFKKVIKCNGTHTSRTIF